MTTTHEQIAGMTCKEVNDEIAIRLGEMREYGRRPDYTTMWHHAGRLFEMMSTDTRTPSIGKYGNDWDCYAFYSDDTDLEPAISDGCATAPEAIARCFLEWYDATHEAQP